MSFILGLAAILSTYLGGLFALKRQDKLHLILAFSAGAVLGVAFFDLLPEAVELTRPYYSVETTTGVIATGFIVYMVLNQWFLLHPENDSHCENSQHKGVLGAGSLAAHSLLDGVAIGLAFKVSLTVGAVVSLAVLVHDFSDGINTVGLILGDRGSQQQARRWLLLDAIAPFMGVVLAHFINLNSASLGLVLALFCGFFLYIGASDLLPESHHRHPKTITTLMILAGAGTLYIAIRLAHLA